MTKYFKFQIADGFCKFLALRIPGRNGFEYNLEFVGVRNLSPF